jgi:tRNA acetyltransferase TAN1
LEYNLLATTEKFTMSGASSQLWMNLRAVGDPDPKVNKTRIRGVVQGATSLDPVEAISLMREHMRSELDRYDKLYRIMPVLSWVETSIDAMVAEVEAQRQKMDAEDSFRVTLEKRRTGLRSLEVIDAVAAVIDNPVDLENPDWVVLVEIMGDRTGVSIIHPDALLNVQKERAKLIFSS